MTNLNEMTITANQLINYLQHKLDKFMQSNERYGMDDRETIRLFDEMIACKEMVEAVICAPVNLQKDGKVTIGF